MHHPRGVYCAKPNGGPPATAAFVEHSRQPLANGCDGLSMFGTTGETNSMTITERIDLIQALVDGGIDPQLTIPGVRLAEAVECRRCQRSRSEMYFQYVLETASNSWRNSGQVSVIEQIGDDVGENQYVGFGVVDHTCTGIGPANACIPPL